MFEPKYLITQKILSSLLEIESAKTTIELVFIPSEWEIKIKNEALEKKAYFGLKTLNLDLSMVDISRLIAYDPGRDEKAEEVAQITKVVGKEKDIQRVLNWINANKYIEQLIYLEGKFKQSGLGVKDMIQIYSLVQEKMVQSQKTGVFRNSDDVEERVDKESDVSAIEVAYQVEDLFLWLSNQKEEVHPLVMAGIIFYELVRICPFEEGNLIVAAIFSGLILNVHGYSLKRMWSVEECLLKNKEVCWLYITSKADKRKDLTEWLEYFLKCLSINSQDTKTKVLILLGDTPTFRSESGRAVSLTERQIVIMEDVTLRGETTIKEIRSMLPTISDDTILRDLKDLIEKKMIKKRGKTKGSTYVINKFKKYR